MKIKTEKQILIMAKNNKTYLPLILLLLNNKGSDWLINELSKLLKVVDGDQKVANSIINKIKTNIEI